MRKKTKVVWTGAIFLSVVTAVCICALFYWQAVNHSLHAETRQYLSEVATQNANAIRKQIEGDFRSIEAIAFWVGQAEDIQSVMRPLREQSDASMFKRIGLILANGDSYASDGRPLHLEQRSYFKRAMAGETVVEAGMIDQADNQPICVYATPMYKDGEITAVLFATHSDKAYAALLDMPLFGGEGYAFIATRSGDIVLGTNSREDAWGGVHNLYSQFDNGSGFTQDPEKMQCMRRDMQTGVAGVTEFKNNGELFFLSFTPIGVNDWNVIATVSENVVAEQSQHLSALAAAICVLSVVITALVSASFLLMQRKNRRTLESLAFTDPLTGGSNWNGFLRTVRRTLEQQGDAPVAMLVFDIDKFKVLNDLFGHEQGNRTLCNIWLVLQDSLYPDEPFARVSADNFNILLRDSGEAAIRRRVDLINKRIVEQCSGAIGDYMLTMSYGVYHVVDKQLDVERMSDRATIARRAAKGKHDELLAFYDDSVREQILAEKSIEDGMQDALDMRQFEMYLQPKYRISTGRIIGAEALVRWNHPTLGLIPPGGFIPLFERNGFVVRLDAFMFGEVCDRLAEWMAHGIDAVPISLNISRLHLHNSSFAEGVIERARASGIPRGKIELELTESTVLDFDVGRLTGIMQELQNAGFVIAMDDFGAGYSSLNLLRHLPVDVLKLDGQFFDFADDLARGETVIADMVMMARHLNMEVVAEGVETLQQVEFLSTVGCDIVQGYYFAKPMPIAAFEALLAAEAGDMSAH